MLLAMRWFRFAVVGFCASLSYFLLGLLFVNLLRLPLLAGNALSYLLSFVISYLGQARWAFQAQETGKTVLLRFAAAQAFGLLLNSLIITLLCGFGMPYVFAMLAALIIVPVVTYLVCKYWVFPAKGKEACK